MEYFSKYTKSKDYYIIYSKVLKQSEWLKFTREKRRKILNVRYEMNEQFEINGLYHTINKNVPALTEYNRFGKKIWEFWYNFGILHRIDCPAIIKYHKNSIIEEKYVINGIPQKTIIYHS